MVQEYERKRGEEEGERVTYDNVRVRTHVNGQTFLKNLDYTNITSN